MNVLIACEFSGIVREAFRKRGHNAWSCDLLPSEIPGNHIQRNVLGYITGYWDLMIAHPPCTYLTVSGVLWCTHIPRNPRPDILYGQDRINAIDEAVVFIKTLANCSVPKIAIENPIGLLTSRWRKSDQVIQPWMFGHEEFKGTGLWLKNLPKLKDTNRLVPPRSGTPEHAKWSKVHMETPGPNRSRNRSRTYQGIADAMAEQWGG